MGSNAATAFMIFENGSRLLRMSSRTSRLINSLSMAEPDYTWEAKEEEIFEGAELDAGLDKVSSIENWRVAFTAWTRLGGI